MMSSIVEVSQPVRIDKQRVAFNFSRAATTYDSAARLQDRVAARTMLGLPSSANPDVVLDLGSGTGSQTVQVSGHYPQACVTGMDLALGMLNHAKFSHNALDWCAGDIEHLPFKSACADIVFSSLAIQWCRLETVLEEVHRVLKPGGFFVFSTLAGGTMHELKQAWAAVDQHVHVNAFDDFAAQKQCAKQSGFQVQSFKLQTETVYYPSVIQLLRDLKALGVNTVPLRHFGLMTRERVVKLRETYELFRTDQGLPLSYQVIYGLLRKPE